MKHLCHGRAQSRERASLLPREESSQRSMASHHPVERKEGMPPSIRATIPFARVYEQLLATYGEAKNEPENDPLRGLSTLFLIISMGLFPTLSVPACYLSIM